MAWVERTFAEVDPPEDGPDEDQHLGEMLRNLPPYMKLTTRRARKALEKYELMKQRHIENLRQNPMYKFVMQVAAFTNEDIVKYWKGKSLTPFMEDHIPEKITISREDLTLMHNRANENAISDLHQFCTRIRAVPMFDTRQRKQAGKQRDSADATGKQTTKRGKEDQQKYLNAIRAASNSSLRSGAEIDISPSAGAANSDSSLDSEDSLLGSPSGAEKNQDSQDGPPLPNIMAFSPLLRNERQKYIYNMNDMEFERFIQRFQNREYPPAEDLRYYALERDSPDHVDNEIRNFNPDGNIESLLRSENSYWNNNVPIIRWDDPYAEYWFQRYVARWLAPAIKTDTASGSESKSGSGDESNFRNRYRIMFNNIVKVDGKVYRDLTGMLFTTPTREPEADANNILDFAKPLYEERAEWWRHELVLGEYEKRSQYQADKWLQKTPWALGKMYIEPKLYGHMVEAHVMVTTRFKKFQNASVEDLVQDERHSFFMSKLVAMCINTSAILSGKKYGLDRMYMRMNFEKRKLLHAWSRLPAPNRILRRAPNIVYGRRQPR